MSKKIQTLFSLGGKPKTRKVNFSKNSSEIVNKTKKQFTKIERFEDPETGEIITIEATYEILS